jgi:hypothetical protein
MLHVDPTTFGLERPAAGIMALRGISEQAQVGGVRAGPDPRTDRVHDTGDPFSRKPIENWGLCGLQGGQSGEFNTRTVPYSVQHKHDDLVSSHQRRLDAERVMVGDRIQDDC